MASLQIIIQLKQQAAMKRRNKLFLLLMLIGFFQFAHAQDTLKLSHQEFLVVVKNYHPLAFRYRLQNQLAKAEIQSARGNFDPILAAKKGSKTIDGTNYYKETNVGLGIPTWYGVELNGSYNYIDGQRLNNSETKGGLYQFGITLPLSKNLLYDKRRALLDQARFALQMTEAEQLLLTNDLMLEAENAYWEWVKAHEVFLLQNKAVKINQDRLLFIKKTYQYGERAAIDTTEALAQLQSFQLEQKDAYLEFVKATQQLSLFLWQENQQPYEVSKLVFPSESLTDNIAYQNYLSLIKDIDNASLSDHASMLFYFRKQNILESERRFKFQSLLPRVDFTYNFLNKENYQRNLFSLFQNNYQYGFKLELPIFLRQARADYRIVKIKAQQNELDTEYKKQEINSKIMLYKNVVLNYNQQINLAFQNVGTYERLLRAEEVKYSNGESSLFLINSRENKLMEGKEKLLELRLKFLQGYNQLKWTKENFNVGNSTLAKVRT
ncbi:TolC family protein [Pedobacter cryotolerans]|uniref:TolC family protein n=1 Tax=Pedobacter cryotolerans TaxID=2571270 RepID=A0A4U1CAW4_9SPHI|nr:TolC family protein [Pedobacter cryotolerans]TKC03115.1 TolC family protein [Pedobacter cryotolerans]